METQLEWGEGILKIKYCPKKNSQRGKSYKVTNEIV